MKTQRQTRKSQIALNREAPPEVDLYPHFWHPIINGDKQSTFYSLVVKTNC